MSKELIARLRNYSNSAQDEDAAADAIEALEAEVEAAKKSEIERLLRIETKVDELVTERDALQAQLAAAQGQEPLGTLVEYRNHNYHFVTWPQTPYLDNAIDHRLVYAAPIPQQPAQQVNAMLVEALGQAEKLEHEALVALSEATYELKVGNPYTTATDTYKANNDLIHRLDKILNLQYRDRKHAALTAAQQAQPEPAKHDAPHYLEIERSQGVPKLEAGPVPVLYSDTINGCMVRRDDVWLCTTSMLASKQVQPERAGLTVEQIDEIWVEHGLDHCGAHEFARAIEAAHGIKQGGQQ